jgi:hypothetical protein
VTSSCRTACSCWRACALRSPVFANDTQLTTAPCHAGREAKLMAVERCHAVSKWPALSPGTCLHNALQVRQAPGEETNDVFHFAVTSDVPTRHGHYMGPSCVLGTSCKWNFHITEANCVNVMQSSNILLNLCIRQLDGVTFK